MTEDQKNRKRARLMDACAALNAAHPAPPTRFIPLPISPGYYMRGSVDWFSIGRDAYEGFLKCPPTSGAKLLHIGRVQR